MFYSVFLISTNKKDYLTYEKIIEPFWVNQIKKYVLFTSCIFHRLFCSLLTLRHMFYWLFWIKITNNNFKLGKIHNGEVSMLFFS
jgi:hypothetical protein